MEKERRSSTTLSVVAALAVLSRFAPRELTIEVAIVVSILIIATAATIIVATITGAIIEWFENG